MTIERKVWPDEPVNKFQTELFLVLLCTIDGVPLPEGVEKDDHGPLRCWLPPGTTTSQYRRMFREKWKSASVTTKQFFYALHLLSGVDYVEGIVKQLAALNPDEGLFAALTECLQSLDDLASDAHKLCADAAARAVTARASKGGGT